MGKNITMRVATIQMYHGTCTPLGDHTMMITQNRNSEERISTAAPRPPSTSCSKSSPVAGSDHATLRRTDHVRPSTPDDRPGSHLVIIPQRGATFADRARRPTGP